MNLFQDGTGVGDIEAATAVFLGNVDAEPAHLSELVVDLAWRAPFAVALADVLAGDLAGAECADRLSKHLLFGAEFDEHD